MLGHLRVGPLKSPALIPRPENCAPLERNEVANTMKVGPYSHSWKMRNPRDRVTPTLRTKMKNVKSLTSQCELSVDIQTMSNIAEDPTSAVNCHVTR
jgi:hypothetical protein